MKPFFQVVRVDEPAAFRRRLHTLFAITALTLCILIARLGCLQGFHGGEYTRRSAENLLEEQRIPALRGLILDVRGRVLAKNRPTYDLYVTPRFTTPESIDRLMQLLDVSPESANPLRARLAARQGRGRNRPLRLLRDLDRNQFARIETEKSALDGIRISVAAQRAYPEGATAAHVLGYLNEAQPEEIGDSPGAYTLGDWVGRFGIEKMWEAELRGKTGTTPAIVDARGRVQRRESLARMGLLALLDSAPKTEAQAGNTIRLTLDLDLQKAAERALRGHPSGAIVALDAQTGRIIAMVSKPAFDPNVMTGRLTPASLLRIEKNPYRPLIDKALREDYFPGSVFKVIPAIAALEYGIIDPREQLRCTGAHELGRRAFHCTRAHGWMNLEQAIVQSCNVYFYRLAERVGMDRMAQVAQDLGLGAPSGLGMNNEAGGFVPTKAWYEAKGNEGFRIGFTLNAAIGQGSTKVTVLQMALLYAAIGNGGRLWSPQIVDRIETAEGRLLKAFPPQLRRVVSTKSETLALLTRALTGVVTNRKGTAFDQRPRDSLEVAGKTGTAQMRRRQEGVAGQEHAWFVAFAPAEEPKISIAVLVDHGGQGSKTAAPIAMEVLHAYFNGAPASVAATKPAP